jgi:hypothetical protein
MTDPQPATWHGVASGRSDEEEQMAEQKDWWWDLKTKSAVQDSKAGKATDRLGPYASREEAENALAKVEERNEAYDHDARWDD